MSVFVDTSAIVALLDARDPLHLDVTDTFEWLLDSDVLVSHSHVAVEAVAVLQRRGGLRAVQDYVLSIEPVLELEWVDEGLHRAGLAALLAGRRRRVSLVDHVSFEVMRRRGIPTALTLDPHFRDEGFETLPVPRA